MRWPIVKPRVRTVNANRIDTERLILRTPNPDYASEISRMIGNWRVAHWLVRVPYPYRIEHAVAWIERSNEERAAGVGWPFLIIRRDGNEMVGSIDLSIDDDNRSSGAIGYWLGEDYWGHGYGTEAARAIIGFAFGILRLEEVTANALPDNDRSIRVLEKAGLIHIGRRDEETFERGRVETEFFALKRSSWRRSL